MISFNLSGLYYIICEYTLDVHNRKIHCCLQDSQNSDTEHDSVFELLCLPLVPVVNRSVITGNSAVDRGAASAFGTHVLPSRQISAGLADRVDRRQRIIRNIMTGRYVVQKIPRLLPVVKLAFHINMEHSSCRIKRLQLILIRQSIFQGTIVVRRQLRTVRIIRCISFVPRRPDTRKFLLIQHGETVGSRLSRRRLKTVEIPVFQLVSHDLFLHMI